MASAPQVMISSTFYDLRQVRADLMRFIADEAGCIPLVSEEASFPVDPDLDAIENCRRRVEEDADILVLMIGGRYGSVDSRSDRSVSNLEYLAARAKGIPIYAFVTEDVLAHLPTWKRNPNADFSATVDDPRIFEFIDEVRGKDAVWTVGFTLAQHVIVALRHRFAELMAEGLTFIRHRRDDPTFRTLSELHGKPLRIALEKPFGWQYKLFAELLQQELRSARALRHGQRLGITYGAFQWVSLSEVESWGRSRLAEVIALVQALDVIANRELPKALGTVEEPGDTDMVVRCTRQLGEIYREAIEWSRRVRRSTGEAWFEPLAQRMTSFADDVMKAVEVFGRFLSSEVEPWLLAVENGEDRDLVIKIDIDLPGAKVFSEEVRALRERIRRGSP